MLQHRPYVIINVAQSINGFISGPGGKPVVISSAEDTKRVHLIRKSVDAVLIGANTVINDNPELKFNELLVGSGKQPLRVVLDSNLRTPESSRVLDGSAQTVIFNAVKAGHYGKADLLYFDRSDLSISRIIHTLDELGVKRILVEGGATVINEFIRSGSVDEFYIYIGNCILPGKGIRLFDPDIEMRDIVSSFSLIENGILVTINVKKLCSMVKWK
jgi:riboflavin-specific deaminase-like protein